MGSIMSCPFCFQPLPMKPKSTASIFISLTFPSYSQAGFRFPVYDNAPFLIPPFIIKKIESNVPFEVTVYDDSSCGTHASSYFFLPSSFKDEHSYRITFVEDTTYDITPITYNKQNQYYCVWLRISEKNGKIQPVSFFIQKNMI
jgi:hypothetical protein